MNESRDFGERAQIAEERSVIDTALSDISRQIDRLGGNVEKIESAFGRVLGSAGPQPSKSDATDMVRGDSALVANLRVFAEMMEGANNRLSDIAGRSEVR